MRPFTMWVVLHPEGYPLRFTVCRTRVGAQAEFRSMHVFGPLSTWRGAYRAGYRCVRVVCTPAAGDRREADRG